MAERRLRAVVVGAGIAGLTTALALERRGHRTVVVERSALLRDEGYMIDFYGPGFDAAERLGLLGDLARIHREVPYLVFVDDRGRERISLPYRVMRRRVFHDRHFNFPRGDLERVLYEQIRDRVEFRFGRTVAALDDGGVVLDDGSRLEADVVVGAGGVHSPLRALRFGPEERYRVPLGHAFAVFVSERVPSVGTDRFVTLTAPGRMVAAYPVDDRRSAVFFCHRAEVGRLRGDPREILPEVFGGLGWIVPQLLEAALAAEDLYFDEAVQIVSDRWHDGRLALVGDAAWCVSFLAGQGASLALSGAAALADALSDSADVPAGLALYERRVRAEVAPRQKAGRDMVGWFVPLSPLRMAVRDLALRASVWPLLSSIFARSVSARGAS